MSTWVCTRQNELYHHGIKGQKWGVRRFQNKDGSLTPAGKRRYDEPNIGRKASESVTIDGQTFKVYGRNNKQYADKVAKNAKDIGATVSRESKIKEAKKYKIPENKSLHRLKLEEKYMQNGMTREQAEQAAAKRIRAEKFVAAAAVVTVAACIGYAKYKGYTSDKIIKENSDFQRIMRLNPNAEIRKDYRQYVTIDKKDKVLYKGMFADHINKLKDDGENIYDITVKNRNSIKVASEKRARDTFANLFKNDKEFKAEFVERLQKDGYAISKGRLDGIFNKMKDNPNSLSDREIKTKAYDLFNVMLAEPGERTQKNSSRFYEALRKQGISAIVDVNDSKINNYHAKMPLILFDGEFDNATKRIMDNKEIQQNMNKYINRSSNQSYMALGAAAVGLYGAIPIYNKAQIDKKRLEYKEKHPNTKMTDSEITAMIKKELSNK